MIHSTRLPDLAVLEDNGETATDRGHFEIFKDDLSDNEMPLEQLYTLEEPTQAEWDLTHRELFSTIRLIKQKPWEYN